MALLMLFVESCPNLALPLEKADSFSRLLFWLLFRLLLWMLLWLLLMLFSDGYWLGR